MAGRFRYWINFRFMPASWGLVGDAYEEAKAHYYLDGIELEKKLLEIRYKEEEPKTYAIKLNDINLKYKNIDAYEHATKLNEIENEDLHERTFKQIDLDVHYNKLSRYDADVKKLELKYAHTQDAEKNIERELELLDIEYHNNVITKTAYEKKKSIIKNEPWVAFIDSGYDPQEGIDGFRFELDWNSQWVELLKLHGFVGKTESEVVEDWFIEVCRSNAQMNETGITVLGPTTNYPLDFERPNKG